MLVYKVFLDLHSKLKTGQNIVIDNIQGVQQEIKNLLDEGDEDITITIITSEMTQKELDNLPEFGGW